MADATSGLSKLALGLMEQAETQAKSIAPVLLGKGGADAAKLSHDQLVQYVRDNWPVPGFPQKTLDRLAPRIDTPQGPIRPRNGLDYYLALVAEAFPQGYEPPPPPAPPPVADPTGLPAVPGAGGETTAPGALDHPGIPGPAEAPPPMPPPPPPPPVAPAQGVPGA